jgi:uncharacterized membrane protein YgcG
MKEVAADIFLADHLPCALYGFMNPNARKYSAFAAILVLLIALISPSPAQSLADQMAQAEEVAKDQDAADAASIAQTLGNAFGAGQDTNALLEAAQQLAASNPGDAAAISAAATVFIPTEAPRIAAAIASIVPGAAPAIAAAAASVATAAGVPNAATSVAAAVAQTVPSSAGAVADAVVAAVPDASPDAVNAAVTAAASDGGSGGGGTGGSTGSVPLPSGFAGGGGGGSGGTTTAPSTDSN